MNVAAVQHQPGRLLLRLWMSCGCVRCCFLNALRPAPGTRLVARLLTLLMVLQAGLRARRVGYKLHALRGHALCCCHRSP